MQTATDPDTPRRYGRRRFWRNFLGELISLQEESQGIVQMSLDDLSAVPPDVMAQMVPVWRESSGWTPASDGIYQLDADGNAASLVHAFTDEERRFAGQIGCGGILADIAGCHPQEAAGCPEFGDLRGIFIEWCRRGWCHPAAPHAAAPP